MKPILSAVFLLAASTAPAFSFMATNGLAVQEAGDRTFHVDFGPIHRKSDFLCAAADYASRGLGLPGSTRLYRESLAPRRSGEGITFTFDPARQVPMQLHILLWTDENDGGISVQNAKSLYCNSSPTSWR